MSLALRKNRRRAAANCKWQVFLDHLTDDRGNEVLDYLTIASLEPRPENVTGVCILPIYDNRFLLVRSYRHALATELWETPRGFMETGETPAQAAWRELAEETGLSCAKEDLLPLGFYAPEPSTMTARGGLFVARNCAGVLRAAEDEIGLGSLHLFSAGEMDRLVADGVIEDAGTLICYYRYREWIYDNKAIID